MGNQIGMNQLIALFTFVAMSNLVLSNYLSSSNPSEVFSRLQTQVKKSKRILRSSLKLSQVFHQDLDLSAFTELDDALFTNLAHTLAGEVELAADFF